MSIKSQSQYNQETNSRSGTRCFRGYGLLFTAGAGMGVDSGLPDFRGDKGFWKAYPALFGHSFSDMANPSWFDSDPRLAWGFYGHRLNSISFSGSTQRVSFSKNGLKIVRTSSLPPMWMVNSKSRLFRRIDSRVSRLEFTGCSISIPI